MNIFPIGRGSFCADSWTIVNAEVPSDRYCRSIWADSEGRYEISGSSSSLIDFWLKLAGIAEFGISFLNKKIFVSRVHEGVTEDTIEHLLADQIWPRVIAHGGSLVLHAAGVLTPLGAIIVAGHSGSGKSTLAASLHQIGYPLLGDDAIVVSSSNSEIYCNAVYPSLRLFPDSISSVFAVEPDNSPVAHYSEKRSVHLQPTCDRDSNDFAVRAIFVLNPESTGADPKHKLMTPAAACIRLIEHSFWLDPTDINKAMSKLRFASLLAGCVPTFELVYPRDFCGLVDVHAAIFAALVEGVAFESVHEF